MQTTALGAAGLSAASPLPGKETNVYTRLGLRTFINLTATVTINGGALMLPEVGQAMEQASRDPVNLDELMEKVGERLATLFGCEFGIVTSGCAAALALATAGVIAGADPETMQQLPDLTGLRSEVIMPRPSRNPFDRAIRMTGARIVTIDTREEFQAALSTRTAMIAVLGIAEAQGGIRLEEMAALAHKAGVPVLVDAAAELPVKPNPYLSRGADLVGYSGGKILRGPQCSGLLLGRKDLVRAAWANSSPHDNFGRPMKAGKEEIIGMLTAAELWAGKRDIQAEYRTWERWLNEIGEAVAAIPGVQTKMAAPAGRSPFPVLQVKWDPGRVGLTAGEVGRRLREGEPRIMSHAEGAGHEFEIRPVSMRPGEARLVAARLAEVLRSAPPATAQAPAAPVRDLSGQWTVEVLFVSGKAAHTLELAAEGNAITGTHRTRRSAAPVHGSVDGDRVRIASAIPCEGQHLAYTFRGTVSGDTMAGEVDLGDYGTARWSARRA